MTTIKNTSSPVTLVQGVVKSNKADKYLKETITEILEEGQ